VVQRRSGASSRKVCVSFGASGFVWFGVWFVVLCLCACVDDCMCGFETVPMRSFVCLLFDLCVSLVIRPFIFVCGFTFGNVSRWTKVGVGGLCEGTCVNHANRQATSFALWKAVI